MMWQSAINIAFGIILAVVGIMLMGTLNIVLSILLVAAGGFIAVMSFLNVIEVFRNPPYTRNYTSDWF